MIIIRNNENKRQQPFIGNNLKLSINSYLFICVVFNASRKKNKKKSLKKYYNSKTLKHIVQI